MNGGTWHFWPRPRSKPVCENLSWLLADGGMASCVHVHLRLPGLAWHLLPSALGLFMNVSAFSISMCVPRG